MMKKLFLCLCILSSLIGADISKKNKPITVKVLLTKLSDEALIEIKGRYHLFNPRTEEHIPTSLRKKRIKVTASEAGIHWGEPLRGIYELRVVPAEPKCTIHVNGVQYKGCLEVYSIGGTINVVNEVDVQNYLKSVLGLKISDRIKQEALDAIVITERTNLFYHLQKDSFASWHLEAQKVGYMGTLAAKQNVPVQESVNRTRDIILNYQKQPFAASWSINHAGSSVSYSSVFRKQTKTPIGVTHLPSVHMRERTKWKFTTPLKNLATIAELPEITDIALFHAEKKDKVYAIRFKGPTGHKDLNFMNLQNALGSNLLQSNDFDVEIKGKKATFTGYGKGLGVGLCALSADIMAKRKTSVEKILSSHFPDTELVNMREETGASPYVSFIWK